MEELIITASIQWSATMVVNALKIVLIELNFYLWVRCYQGKVQLYFETKYLIIIQ